MYVDVWACACVCVSSRAHAWLTSSVWAVSVRRVTRLSAEAESFPSIFISLFDLLQLQHPRRSTACIVQIQWRAPAGSELSLGHTMWPDLSYHHTDYPGEWKAFKAPDNSWVAAAWHYIFHCVKNCTAESANNCVKAVDFRFLFLCWMKIEAGTPF